MRRCLLLLLAGCGATYTDTHKVETTWYGAVSTVEGGGTQAHAPGAWLGGLSDLTGNLTWLLVVVGVLFLYLCWKFPSFLRTIKDRRAAKAAIHSRERTP